jgi:CubicO group peptidase (beta-lactamase class C family)
MMRAVMLAMVLLVAVLPAHAQRVDVADLMARLEPEIRQAMVEGGIPSLAIALVNRDGVLHATAYGESNVWAGVPARAETVYLIGSTFKAQSTVALLQLMEAGHFTLDDPVRRILPDDMVIRGEDPARPVTFRHLLTHTSGLPAAYGPHPVWGETVPPPLDVYLRDSLAVGGPPLERVVYSNIAYTLVGYLVERISGMPYRDYIRDRVWRPLGMTETAFAPTPA